MKSTKLQSDGAENFNRYMINVIVPCIVCCVCAIARLGMLGLVLTQANPNSYISREQFPSKRFSRLCAVYAMRAFYYDISLLSASFHTQLHNISLRISSIYNKTIAKHVCVK